MQKAPRSEVSASLRDLNSGSNRLPWTEAIVFVTSASGQRVVIIGPGVVFSKDANGCSGRGVRKRGIAARIVSEQRGVVVGVGFRYVLDFVNVARHLLFASSPVAGFAVIVRHEERSVR